MIHAQGRVTGSQHKSSHKKIPDEREHVKVVGDPVVPKQHRVSEERSEADTCGRPYW